MIEELKKTYQGKKVFLTGHTGFKGAWLLNMLHILGAEVMGYALEPDAPENLYNLINGNKLCQSVIADIRDAKSLATAVKSFEPDFVFHLAAQPLVRLSYQIPAETFEVNAIGTANLLDSIKLLQKRCVAVLITTDKVYHNYEWEFPYRENDRLGGFDPYSASKACAELIIDSYRNSFFNINTFDTHQKAIAVARAGNVIGGGDWAKDRLVPDIVRALSKNEKIEVRNPAAVRPWQHVLEPLAGYLLLGAKLNADPSHFNEAFNFGPLFTDALPVASIVDIAISCWGSGQYFVNKVTNQPHEAGLLKLDVSKAATRIGWHPKFNAQQALSYTIDWYKQYFEDAVNIAYFTERQILQFIS